MVPTTVPRSVSSTRETATAIRPGKKNAMPTANTTVPAYSASGPGARPRIARPTAVVPRAMSDSRAGPSWSGSLAKTIRRPTTTIA